MIAALTIAGSDSGGGAGIQADLKTFAAHKVFGTSAITALTAQNTQGVFGVMDVEADFVALQIKTVLDDIKISAIKVGMLSNADIIQAVANTLRKYPHIPVVLDPVMVAKSGDHLLDPSAKQALINHLLPLATVITPNLHEASVMVDFPVKTLADMQKAAQQIYSQTKTNVLVKGGHLAGDAEDLLYDGQQFTSYKAERLPQTNTHGTGCTYSAAIAANLAHGLSLTEAIGQAKEYITNCIKHCFPLGKGIGPTHHFYNFY